jgi:hypothetical protein
MAVQVNYHMVMEPIRRRMLIAIKGMREIYVPPILVAITFFSKACTARTSLRDNRVFSVTQGKTCLASCHGTASRTHEHWSPAQTAPLGVVISKLTNARLESSEHGIQERLYKRDSTICHNKLYIDNR